MKNKILTKIGALVVGLTMAVGVGIAVSNHSRLEARAGDAVYKTALFGSAYNSGKISGYTDSWSSTNDGFTVDLVNWNNNNNGWNYVKAGRKNYASVGTITTHDAIDKAITKVVLTIDALTSSKINSLTLYTSATSSSWTSVGTFAKEAGAQTVTLSSPTKDLYYKIEADCASGSSNGLVTISKIEYYIDDSGSTETKTLESISLSGTTTTSFEQYFAFKHDGLTVTAHYEEDGVADADVTSLATFSTPDMTTVGSKEIIVSYTEGTTKTAKYNIEVTAEGGLEADPYTAEEAIAAIDAGVNGERIKYVSGIVSNIAKAYDSKYGNISFDISVDGKTTSGQLRAYRCFDVDGEWFTSDDDVQVGDIVVVKGTLTKYNSTYELAENCQLVSLERVELSKIEVTKDPTKTEYFVGDTFDPAGMEVKATYTDKSTAFVTDYTVDPSGALEKENTKVTISYTEKGVTKTADVAITVKDRALVDIAIKNAATKTSFEIGETFSSAGLVLDLIYEGSVHADGKAEYTTTNFDGHVFEYADLGPQTVIVYYEGYEGEPAEYEISVERPTLTYKVAGEGEETWAAATEIAVGDIVVLTYVSSAVAKEMTNVTSIGVATNFDTLPAGTYQLAVEAGSQEGSFAFKNDVNYLSWDSGNSLTTDTEINADSSWTVIFDGTTATIRNVGTPSRYLQYNTGSPRFACYTNTQKDLTLYKLSSPITVKTATDALYDAVYNANLAITCDKENGLTSVIDWETVKEAFDSVGAEEKANLAKAISNPDGNMIEKFLSLYDYICAKYNGTGGKMKCENFLSRAPISLTSGNIHYFSFDNAAKNNATLLIVIISVVAISALGAYLFIDKRRNTSK